MQLLLLLVGVCIICIFSCFITIPEGHVGVVKILGKIVGETLSPIIEIPFIRTVTLVKYIQDRDEVKNLNCVSKEGVNVLVNSIQIANSINPKYIIKTSKLYSAESYDQILVVNPLAQKMRELCTKFTVDDIEYTKYDELDDLLQIEIQEQNNKLDTGINIDWVRVTGITIPTELKAKRLLLASEKAHKVLVDETLKRIRSEKEQESFIALEDAKISLQKVKSYNDELKEKVLSDQIISRIKNEIDLDTAETRYKQSEFETRTMSSQYAITGYAEVEKSKHLSQNTKIYYGDKLPNTIYSTGTVLSE